MLNLCWSNTKRFLSVLVVFGKSFVFAKMSKILKPLLPCFGNSVVDWFSCTSQSWAHTEIFHGSLAGRCPNREKYLEYFSNFGFLCFLRLVHRWKVQLWRDLEIFAAYLTTPSRVELPFVKNTSINFSKFCLECFGDWP